ncbi:hypothetical protein OIDMADRAFT_153298 [Oidiodendron maius Zn]|uniref:Uncharacterized protein n=1 Tax=Oidiodendron maius (strain Zn) TaxID=913774 RepID=A0A0C3HKH4_OIDMZ|nr:hypothetical protein OIDMADRAFT_153298 [Oidiodendron maius Zn]
MALQSDLLALFHTLLCQCQVPSRVVSACSPLFWFLQMSSERGFGERTLISPWDVLES